MNSFCNFLLVIIILAKVSQLYACCNTCNTNCCSTCQNQCSTNRCISKCQRTCCVECPTPASSSSTSSTTSTTSTTEEPSVTPYRLVIPIQSSPRRSEQLEKSVSSINQTSTNILNNHNSVNIHVNVNHSLVNNINNTVPSGTAAARNQTETRVVTVPVVVKVPVCWPNCTTTPIPKTTTPWTISTAAPTNCCTIIVPCVTYGCNPYHYRCDGCHGDIGYVPVNPCGSGCYRRQVWHRQRCLMGHCVTRQVDCSYCDDRFYQTYEGYSKCHGCFYGY